MSEAEILHSLRSDLAMLKLTAQVKLSGSRIEIQARHAPGHRLKYDQAARFLRESLRAQQARNQAVFAGIQVVTVMIGVEGDPQYLYNATVNLDATEAGDRDAETIDIDSVSKSVPTQAPHQAETIYFDRAQALAQPPAPPAPQAIDTDAETLVVGRRPATDTQPPLGNAGTALTAPKGDPSNPPQAPASSPVPLPLIVGGIVVAVLLLIVIFLVFS